MIEDGPLWERAAKSVRHAIKEFLAVPIAVVAAFLLLVAGVYFIDAAFWSTNKAPPDRLRWLSDAFGDNNALSSLLSTIATSLITVTSITFSLLLIAVQQGASALTNQVFDQFLRRRGNQLYFGFFVGLSLFALFNLVVTNQHHRPIFGALISVVLTGVALCLIVVLIYTTIDQTRPDTIIEAIRRHVLEAREKQLPLLQATRRAVTKPLRVAKKVASEGQGYVTAINLDRISSAAAHAERADFAESDSRIEVGLQVAMGAYVAYHDPLAELRSGGRLTEAAANALATAVAAAITLDNARDLDTDPSFGIEQLAIIGWNSVSTARSNPNPGILVCHAFRDILSRWSDADEPANDPSSRIVYMDGVPASVISAIESLTVAASESMQHQTLAEVMRTLALLLPKLSPGHADQIANSILRSLSALGEHVLTGELECALDFVTQALAASGREATAKAVARAQTDLRRSVGFLNSRSTRVPTGN